jgi:polar amino acid transport system substrate-binding protein
MRSHLRPALVVAAAAATLTAAGTADATSVPPTEPAGADTTVSIGTIPDPAACAEGLTLEDGVLTIATGEPTFPPYFIDDANLESGEGFEAAVAYAVAEQMGFAHDDVAWVRTPFEAAIQPGPKEFDFNIQQYAITDERAEVVSFSAPYYTRTHAIVATEDSPAVGAATLPDLQELRLGVAAGTTSLAVIETVIQPSADPQVFNDNAAAVQALSTRQVDALVVDLPTALFMAAAQLDDGVVVGQFPQVESAPGEDWGLLFEKDNPLVDCADFALLRLRESGELDEITTAWMEEGADVPVFDLE